MYIDKKNPNQILQIIDNSENLIFLKELGDMLEYFIQNLDKKLEYFNKNKMTLRRITLLERKDEYESLLRYLNKKITRLEKQSLNNEL